MLTARFNFMGLGMRSDMPRSQTSKMTNLPQIDPLEWLKAVEKVEKVIVVRTRHPAMYPWLKISTRKDQLENATPELKRSLYSYISTNSTTVTIAVVQQTRSVVFVEKSVAYTKCHC